MPRNLRQAEESLQDALGPEALNFITFAGTVEEAVRSADLAIDCVPDELESKLEILFLLDRMAPPRTVIATPTRLSIADLAACTYRPSKVVGLDLEAAGLAADAGREISIRTTARTAPQTVALVDRFWRALSFNPSFVEEPDPIST